MHFYHQDADWVRKQITGAQGWAYNSYAIENEASVWGTNLEKKTPGYVKQEARRINHT